MCWRFSMQSKIQPTDLVEEYIQDIVARNTQMMDHRYSLFEGYMSMPLEEIKSRLRTTMAEDWAYRGFRDADRNPGNDFELLVNEVPKAIVGKYFGDNEDVRKTTEAFRKRKELIKADPFTSDEEKARKYKVAETLLGIKFRKFYDEHLPEIQAKGYEKEHFAQILAGKEAEFINRQIVQQEFNQNRSDDNIIVFDEEKDKGCCTKSLTVSLYKLQEKYGLGIFDQLDDFEDIAHPIPLTEKLKKHIERPESGNLEDVEMLRGDIAFITTPDGTPRHAMLCYDFDEETHEPLLMGFSSIDTKIKANKNNYGESRRGIVLHVNSLIREAYNNLEKSNSNQPINKGNER